MENKKVNNKINRFKQYLIEEEKSKATIEKYVRDVRRFYSFIGNDDVCKERVIDYKNSLIIKYKATSVNSMLVSLNLYLLYIKKPECRVKLMKVQRKVFGNEDIELTKDDYKRLLNVALRKNIKTYLILQTICSTGMRVSELRYVTVESLEKNRVTILNKGKVREILIPSTLSIVLTKFILKNKIESGPIFISKKGIPLNRCNIWKMMKSLCDEAKVSKTKVFPHNLRHLFALTYYLIEKDLVHLADILGHSNIETTRIYTTTSKHDYEDIFIKMGLVDVDLR